MEKFEILLYSVPEGKATIEVFFEEETFWLSQKKMAELFNVEVNTINYHLKEIFNSSELVEKATIRNFRIVQTEGRRQVDYAENQAQRNIAMSMADWVQKLDAFLQFNDYDTLKRAGTISHDIAKKLAEDQYDQYRLVQDRKFESDFDKLAKNLPESGA